LHAKYKQSCPEAKADFRQRQRINKWSSTSKDKRETIVLPHSEQSAEECDATEVEWVDELLVHKNILHRAKEKEE